MGRSSARVRSGVGRAIPRVGTVDADDTPASGATDDAQAQQPAEGADKLHRLKLCFDGQGLFGWPESVDANVGVLSLQHNFIARVPEGLYLPQLVLLDLYDNQLERMYGLRHLETLRVLVIARNRLRKIEGLEQLVQLEVLDLHSNYIWRLAGLDALVRLRVLNLSNNCVRSVASLQRLQSLQQLNLRGNAVRRLAGLETLPRLAKLNLAHNDIRRPEDVECLTKCRQLEELSLSGNTLADQPNFHSFLYKLKQLKLLDNMHVERTVEEPSVTGGGGGLATSRSFPSAPSALRRSRTSSSLASSSGQRARPHSLDRPSGTATATAGSSIVAQGRSLSALRPLTSQPAASASRRLWRRPAAAAVAGRPARTASARLPDLVPVCDRRVVSTSSSGSTAGEEPQQPPANACGCGEKARLARLVDALPGTDARLEIRDTCLLVAGDRALRLLSTWEPNDAGQVRDISLDRVHFDAAAPHIHALRRRFSNASALILGAVQLTTLQQLNALSALGHLQQLTVHPDNDVTNHAQWRLYAVYRLHHCGLTVINDATVTSEEVQEAEQTFAPLGRLAFCSLPEARLVTLAERLWFADCTQTKQADGRPTWEQIQRRLTDPCLQAVIERECLIYCPPQYGIEQQRESLMGAVASAQDAARALRRYRGLLPSLLREFCASAVRQRRAAASSQHQARTLLEQITAAAADDQQLTS